MAFLIILAIIAGTAMILIAATVNTVGRQSNSKEHTPLKARPILNITEQPVFLKLRKALPEHIVLTQVALSAILSSCGQVTRNKLNRYRADFVVLNKELQVIAIIELEDPSQKRPENQKNDCSNMLKEANYRVIRYSHTPDIDQIQRDFASFSASRKKSAQPTQSPMLTGRLNIN
jgi:very-short-patch-repair endonuclease